LLQQLTQQLQGARETADGAARTLAGEQTAAPMGMPGGDAMGGAPAPGGDAMGGAPAPDMGSDLDAGADEFGATDAAAGGQENLGREKR